jgi:hypothetical protein
MKRGKKFADSMKRLFQVEWNTCRAITKFAQSQAKAKKIAEGHTDCEMTSGFATAPALECTSTCRGTQPTQEVQP